MPRKAVFRRRRDLPVTDRPFAGKSTHYLMAHENHIRLCAYEIENLNIGLCDMYNKDKDT
jgi:hypothetical protein